MRKKTVRYVWFSLAFILIISTVIVLSQFQNRKSDDINNKHTAIIASIVEKNELNNYRFVSITEVINQSLLLRFDRNDASNVEINVNQFDGEPIDLIRLFIYNTENNQVFEIP